MPEIRPSGCRLQSSRTCRDIVHTEMVFMRDGGPQGMVGRRHARAVGELAYRWLWPEELHGGILLCCQFRRTFHALARRTLAQDSIARDECRPEGCRVLPLACSKRRSAVNQRPRFLLCPRRAVAASHERSALLQSHGGRSRPKRHGDQGQQHRCGRARARDARPPFPGRAIAEHEAKEVLVRKQVSTCK